MFIKEHTALLAQTMTSPDVNPADCKIEIYTKEIKGNLHCRPGVAENNRLLTDSLNYYILSVFSFYVLPFYGK